MTAVRGRGRVVPALVGAGLLLLARRSPADPALPAATDHAWTEVRSARFEISTEGDEGRARAIARHLERLAEALEATTRGFVADSARPVRILVFRDRESFHPYCPFPDDEFGNTVGFHVSGEDAEYIAVYGADDDPILRFVSHEYLHAVLARSFGPLPLWVNEGLAEFYSTFVPRRDLVDIGRPIPEHVAWLQQHQAPVRDILLLGGNSPDYTSGPRRQTVYAQSWALVHGLVLDPVEGGARFGRLIGRLSAGDDDRRAIEAIYGPNAIDSLDAELRRRMTLLTLPYAEDRFPTTVEALPLVTRLLDRADVASRLGELLVHASDGRANLARDHLEAAWRADSTRTIPAAWLAVLAARLGDAGAVALWTRRVEDAKPADPRASAIVGMAMTTRRIAASRDFTDPAPGADAAELEARTLLERAIAADHVRSEWLLAYGLTFLDDRGGSPTGIGALIDARGALPHRADVVGGLAILNVRARNPGAALALLRQIPPGPNHDRWHRAVLQLLLDEERSRADSLSARGEAAPTESLMARVRDGVDETWETEFCGQVIDELRDREKRRLAAHTAAPPRAGGAPVKPATGGARDSNLGRPTSAPSAADRASAEHEYEQAMAAGAFTTAERIAGEIAKGAAARDRAHADSLGSEARSRKAIESAEELIRLGSTDRACEFLDRILRERPTAGTRAIAERLRRQSCHSSSAASEPSGK